MDEYEGDPFSEYSVCEVLGDSLYASFTSNKSIDAPETYSYDTSLTVDTQKVEIKGQEKIKHELEEPATVKKWRVEHKIRLDEMDAEERKKKEKLRKVAKEELEEWYTIDNERIAKAKISNRNSKKLIVAESNEIQLNSEWENISKLCNFNKKSSCHPNKNVSRMKTIILSLQMTPLKNPIIMPNK